MKFAPLTFTPPMPAPLRTTEMLVCRRLWGPECRRWEPELGGVCWWRCVLVAVCVGGGGREPPGWCERSSPAGTGSGSMGRGGSSTLMQSRGEVTCLTVTTTICNSNRFLPETRKEASVPTTGGCSQAPSSSAPFTHSCCRLLLCSPKEHYLLLL